MRLNSSEEIAKSPDSNAERLSLLAGTSKAIDRLLARHPNASPSLLEKLSHSRDKTTRKHVAIHPNAPKSVLLELATQFPGDFYKNPALDWLLLEEPELLFGLGHGVLKNILKRTDCPASFTAWAVERGDAQQKLAVAMNLQTPEDQLRRLVAQGGDPGDAARWHQKLRQSADGLNPSRVLEDEVKAALALLTIEEAKTLWRRGAIGPAQWVWLSLCVRLAVPGRDRWSIPDQALLETPDEVEELGILSAIAAEADLRTYRARAKLAGELKGSLGRSPDRYSHRLATHRLASDIATSADTLAGMAVEGDQYLRFVVAGNPSTPIATLENLARDTEAGVRKRVADNPSTPIATRETLARDANAEVREAVACNPSTPLRVLEELAIDPAVKTRCGVASNPSSTSELLKRLSIDDGTTGYGASVRQTVAAHPSTPPEVLERLALNDSKSWSSGYEVHQAVAGNPRTPGAALVELSRHSDKRVLRAVARNPATPVEALVRLATEKNLKVLATLAENPAAPLPVLQRLGRIKDAKVMAGLARNPACPPSIVQLSAALRWRHDLTKLAKSLPDDAVAKLPSLPQDESLIGMFMNECRLVMSRPGLSVIAQLIGADENQVMMLPNERCRSAARSSVRAVRLRGLHHRKADPAELVKSHQSVDWSERLAIAGNPAAPSNVIEALAKDSNRLVALQARATEPVKSADAAARAALLAAAPARLDCVPLATEVCKRLRLLDSPIPKRLIGTPWWRQLRPIQRNGHFDISWLNEPHGLSVADESRLLAIFAKDPEGAIKLGALRSPSPAAAVALAALATDSREWVRREIAELTHTPDNALRLLAKDKSDTVRRDVAGNTTTPVDALEALSKLANNDVRHAVAGNPSTPLPVLVRLSLDKETSVRRAVVGNAAATPALREAVLELLALDTDIWILRYVARNAATPLSVKLALLERLANESDVQSRRDAAEDTATISTTLLKLALDADPYVRVGVAKNTGAPVATLEKLASDTSKDVRAATAANPSTPMTLLSTLANDLEIDVAREVGWAISRRRGEPLAQRQAVLEKLADHKFTSRRHLVAESQDAPPALLEELAQDKDHGVLRAVALNPASPPTAVRLALESLAANNENGEFVASHPSTPAAVLERLALTTECSVIAAVACNPASPMALRRDISLALAVDEDAAVRKRIAANDATPDSALFELAESDFWEVRFSALKNPSFPADRRDQSMGKLAQEIRDALEPGPSIGPDDFNPEDFSLPLEVLELLPPKEDRKAIAKAAKSRDWLQRAATTLCEGVTVGELRRLLDDEVDVITQLAVVRLNAIQTK